MCQHKNLISYVMKSTFIGLTLTTILLKGLNLIPDNPSIPLLLIIDIKQFVLIAFTCLLHSRLLVHPVSSEGISPDELQVITGLQAVWANPGYPIPLFPLRLPPLSRMPIGSFLGSWKGFTLSTVFRLPVSQIFPFLDNAWSITIQKKVLLRNRYDLL